MNKENDWNHVTAASMVEGPIKNITHKKIAIAIKVIKPEKVAEPSEEMISASKEVGVSDGGTLPTCVRWERNAR